jgi:thiamine biosynthesis lipoprotein
MTGEPFTSVHEPLLGTRVVIRLRAADAATAEAAERAVVAEFERLEALLSAYRPDSAWSRWRRADTDAAGPEIAALLTLAAHWHRVSGGAYNPLAGVLRARWLRAERDGVPPSPEEMAALAAAVCELPYRLGDGGVQRTGDCSLLDLHAIAKGWIVDRAAAVAVDHPGVHEVLVNAGGDLLHRGPDPIQVGIEDPRRPFDNAAPLTTVRLRDSGLATSSGSRRPLRIAGTRYSHVLDPHTGWPVQAIASATTIAPDAATADALATVVGVLPIAEGLAVVDGIAGASCCLVGAEGELHVSARWPRAMG